MKRHLLLLALPFLLAACPESGSDIPAAATPPTSTATATTAPAANDVNTELGRYHWRLQDATDASGQRIDALFVRTDKPVQLDFADGRVGVGNTCNPMGGGYALAGDTLTVARLASTMMACADPKLMALDGEIGKRLEGASKLTLASGDVPALTLATTSGDKLVFAGDPTAQTRYGGPGERVFLEVAAQTRPCSDPLIPDRQCLQVREIEYDDQGLKVGTPGEFEHFYANIEGYTHEPGVRNVLRVNRFTIANPPADAPAQAYVLDMVVESEHTP